MPSSGAVRSRAHVFTKSDSKFPTLQTRETMSALTDSGIQRAEQVWRNRYLVQFIHSVNKYFQSIEYLILWGNLGTQQGTRVWQHSFQDMLEETEKKQANSKQETGCHDKITQGISFIWAFRNVNSKFEILKDWEVDIQVLMTCPTL